MARYFQLIELSSGNVTGEFSTTLEAQKFLARARRKFGEAEVLGYAIAEMDELGNIHRSFQDSDLLSWLEEGNKTIGSAAD